MRKIQGITFDDFIHEYNYRDLKVNVVLKDNDFEEYTLITVQVAGNEQIALYSEMNCHAELLNIDSIDNFNENRLFEVVQNTLNDVVDIEVFEVIDILEELENARV